MSHPSDLPVQDIICIADRCKCIDFSLYKDSQCLNKYTHSVIGFAFSPAQLKAVRTHWQLLFETYYYMTGLVIYFIFLALVEEEQMFFSILSTWGSITSLRTERLVLSLYVSMYVLLASTYFVATTWRSSQILPLPVMAAW